MELKSAKIDTPEEIDLIFGQAHFIYCFSRGVRIKTKGRLLRMLFLLRIPHSRSD